MRCFCYGAAVLLTVGGLSAQTAATPPVVQAEIRGSVNEPDTKAPVAQAEITLDFISAEMPRMMPSPAKQTFTTKTDDSGNFTFHLDRLGYFVVRSRKDGYLAPGQISGAPSSANIMLTAEAPQQAVKLFLSSPCTVTGRVVDEATDKPVANLRIIAGRATNFSGRRMFRGNSGSTGADGKFEISSLPGEYVVEIGPQVTGKDRVLTKFSDADIKAVDRDFEQSYWPGGHDERAALPVPVSAGATFDAGLLSVRKVPYYRVHVRVPASGCDAEDKLDLSEFHVGYQMDAYTLTLASGLPCGSDLLVTHFPPGDYRLILLASRKGSNRKMSSIPFTIVDRNLELTSTLAHGVTVDGSFVVAEGAKTPDFTSLTVPFLSPIGGIPFGRLDPPRVDAAGKFHLEDIAAVDHRIDVAAAGGYYVKEIRYNGSPIANGILPTERPSMAHSLTIVIDDKPATIGGVVTDDDKPVSKPFLLLARWPIPANQILQPVARVSGDQQGKFQIGGLAPGEYRLVVLRSQTEDRDRGPGTLERAFAAAAKIEVTTGSFQNVTATPSSLR